MYKTIHQSFPVELHQICAKCSQQNLWRLFSCPPLEMYYLRHWPSKTMVLLVLFIEDMPSFFALFRPSKPMEVAQSLKTIFEFVLLTYMGLELVSETIYWNSFFIFFCKIPTGPQPSLICHICSFQLLPVWDWSCSDKLVPKYIPNEPAHRV